MPYMFFEQLKRMKAI